MTQGLPTRTLKPRATPGHPRTTGCDEGHSSHGEMPGQRQSGRNGDKQCLLVTEAWAKVSVTKMRPGQKVTATQGDKHEAGPHVPSRGRIGDQGSETRPESSFPREQMVSPKTHQVLSVGVAQWECPVTGHVCGVVGPTYIHMSTGRPATPGF